MQHNQNSKYPVRRVGLDIGSHSIKGVEILERGSEFVIRSVGCVTIPGIKQKSDMPEQSALVQSIKNLWSTGKFGSNKVVLGLPPGSAYVKWLHLEAADREELDMTARTAATRGAPFPADDAIVDYRVLSSRGTSSRKVHFVVLVAASSPALDTLLDTVESAGLEPLAVDISTAAALRSCGTQKQAINPLWNGQPTAHCIVGAGSTTIAVVRGGEMEFARNVPVGGNDITECIAEHLGVSWADAEKIKVTPGTRLIQGGVLIAPHEGQEHHIPCDNVTGRLAREIQRSLRFFTSQFAEGSYLGMIGATTMSGGGALMKGLDSCLEDQGIDINCMANPFTCFSVDALGSGVQDVGECSAQYTTAVGLAIGDYWSSENGRNESDVAA